MKPATVRRGIAEDFRQLCSLGGRFAGTPSEKAAVEFLAMRLEEITGTKVRREPVPYLGWERQEAVLTLPTGWSLAATPLGRSRSVERLRAKVVDLGRGSADDFHAVGRSIEGRFVLVRHEFMLGSGHIHRRSKYEKAKAAGAAGFIIACHLPGEFLVTGSAGTGATDDIPAVGVSAETGAALAAAGEATMTSLGRFEQRVAENLIVDVPGRSDEFMVVSAHIDGHDLADSAIDNASGLVSLLGAIPAMAASAAEGPRGLRVALFNVEEWALIGSRHHLQTSPAGERERLVLDINLDGVAGASSTTVLTSWVQSVDALVEQANRRHGLGLGIERPYLGNSDHANFLLAGIPALRLCAGWNEPHSNMRYVLTSADTADKVAAQELESSAEITALLFEEAQSMEFPRLEAAEVERLSLGMPGRPVGRP